MQRQKIRRLWTTVGAAVLVATVWLANSPVAALAEGDWGS
jgi:hypothetical protein